MRKVVTNGNPESEAHLWNDFRKGCKRAFERLYRLHYAALYHYGHRITPDTEIVRDCIQTLFIDLWRRREYLGETDQVLPYLYRSMRRLLLKHLKKQHNSHPQHLLSPDIQPSTEEDLIRSEKTKHQKVRLQQALLALTQKQQEIVHLRFYENLDNQTIAKRMGIQVNTVYNLVSLALANLRLYLKNSPDLFFFLLLYRIF